MNSIIHINNNYLPTPYSLLVLQLTSCLHNFEFSHFQFWCACTKVKTRLFESRKFLSFPFSQPKLSKGYCTLFPLWEILLSWLTQVSSPNVLTSSNSLWMRTLILIVIDPTPTTLLAKFKREKNLGLCSNHCGITNLITEVDRNESLWNQGRRWDPSPSITLFLPIFNLSHF